MSFFPLQHSRTLLGGLLFGVCVAAAFQPAAQGQDTFTATLQRKNPNAEPESWLSLTNITPNNIIPATSADALCFDWDADVPLAEPGDADVPSEVHEYRFSDLSAAFDQTGGSAAGVALVHWLYDTYYETYFTTPGPDSEGAVAFQDVLWELELDFDGSAASLSWGAGFSPLSNPLYAPHGAMLAGLQDRLNAPGFDADYRSATYGLAFAHDISQAFPNDQSLIISWVIPEPSTSLLLGAMGALALRRRRVMA